MSLRTGAAGGSLPVCAGIGRKVAEGIDGLGQCITNLLNQMGVYA
jgi:hypothetical protein